MNNNKLGRDFEEEFCKLLAKDGFWAYNTRNKQSGQPADVIAAKDNVPYLIDCKVCSDGKFQMSRVEENQRNAMLSFYKKGNRKAYFAFKLEDNTIWIADAFRLFLQHTSSVNVRKLGMELSEWIKFT